MMTTVLAPTESLQRVRGRGLLLSILEKETILTEIKVFDGGCFAIEAEEWSSYWQPLHKLGHKKVKENLDALHSAWRAYLRSGFNSSLRQEFCFCYFSLLDVLLYSESDAAQSWLYALHAALGFECFRIASATADGEVLGAGTCTIRNPCYLLAKLRMPDALDDPQFLPVITVAGTKKPKLFYHYRRYTLSPDSPISLIFYPAVSKEKRSTSFRLINSLAGGVGYGVDPRTRERAKRLYHKIIQPIVETNQMDDSGTIWLEFVDVGAGSGGLTSTICRQIHDMGFKLRFQLWFVDLEPADPTRFFHDIKLRSAVDSLSFLGDDYRSWLSRKQPLPAAKGLRIALVSKLFNNLSHFSIRRLNRSESIPLFEKMATSPNPGVHLPHRCLAPGGKGAEALVISNTRLALPDGRSFVQASLSHFYNGLFLISAPEVALVTDNSGIFLLVRSFNPECLVTSGGRSVISCLIENCDYVVIEDADLRPQDLVEHMKTFSLHSITIKDMTKALGLTRNYAYIIWLKSKPKEEPNLGGEWIW